ncbi:MAG TPA: hypothetical protein VLA37_14525 [Sphingomonadaceae bacterium]|nr:hypothetical protein [Sphingomonadaceae bacterium]
MTEEGQNGNADPSAPWHLWAIGVVALLWYVSGAYTIQMSQLGLREGLTADEVAYYADKPAWLVATTAIATYGSVIASILLLLRNRWAEAAFGVALAFILLNNMVELANGTSRIYANNVAATVTAIIAVIAALLFLYARAMKRRGVLR